MATAAGEPATPPSTRRRVSLSERPSFVKSARSTRDVALTAQQPISRVSVDSDGNNQDDGARPAKKIVLTDRMRKLMTVSVLDDFSQRLQRSRSLRLLSKQEKRISLWLAVTGALSIVLMVVQVELRLGSLEDPRLDLDILRGVNVALTLAMIGLLLVHHRAHHKLIRQIMTETSGLYPLEVIFECAVMLLGVWPPGLELNVHPWLVQPNNDDSTSPVWHIDQLGVLMFVRVPFILRWLV